MDFKTMAVAATLGGSVLLSGLTFSGTINLGDIKTKGLDWANKVSLVSDETQEMLEKFTLFKGDVTTQLNEKIAKINDLNAQIADLLAQGQGDLGAANDEIARLNAELEKANAEIQALKDEFNLTDEQVQQAFASMATAEDMDTTLALDAQNPDTVIPAQTTPTEPTPEPTEPVAPVNDYATEEQAIKNAILTEFPNQTALVVEVTDTQVKLTGQYVLQNDGSEYVSHINSVLDKSVYGAWSTDSTNKSYTYNLQ